MWMKFDTKGNNDLKDYSLMAVPTRSQRQQAPRDSIMYEQKIFITYCYDLYFIGVGFNCCYNYRRCFSCGKHINCCGTIKSFSLRQQLVLYCCKFIMCFELRKRKFLTCIQCTPVCFMVNSFLSASQTIA